MRFKICAGSTARPSRQATFQGTLLSVSDLFFDKSLPSCDTFLSSRLVGGKICPDQLRRRPCARHSRAGEQLPKLSGTAALPIASRVNRRFQQRTGHRSVLSLRESFSPSTSVSLLTTFAGKYACHNFLYAPVQCVKPLSTSRAYLAGKSSSSWWWRQTRISSPTRPQNHEVAAKRKPHAEVHTMPSAPFVCILLLYVAQSCRLFERAVSIVATDPSTKQAIFFLFHYFLF